MNSVATGTSSHKQFRAKPKTRSAELAAVSPASGVTDRLDTILRAIEEDILAGKMLPGQRLDERVLAMRFGLSRTPIREVLVRLSSLGIVELRHNKGAFVATIHAGRLIGMLEVLNELKVLAARQAARRMTVEERRNIIGTKERMMACVEKGQVEAYFDIATALHDEICAGAHNLFLLETVRNIQICLCAYRRHLSRILHLPLKTSLAENCNVVDAIVQGDASEAEHWMGQQTELRQEEFADLIALVSEDSLTEAVMRYF